MINGCKAAEKLLSTFSLIVDLDYFVVMTIIGILDIDSLSLPWIGIDSFLVLGLSVSFESELLV